MRYIFFLLILSSSFNYSALNIFDFKKVGFWKTKEYDDRLNQELIFFQPDHNTLELLVSYYEKKYRCAINLEIYPINRLDFSSYFSSIKNQNSDNEYRLGCILGTFSSHAVPVVYIEKNAKKYLLILDSLGLKNFAFVNQKNYLDHVSKFFGTVFVIENKRQVDHYSCFLDALLILRDITAKEDNTHYKFSDIINYLDDSSFSINQYCNVSRIDFLPAQLLKTVQNTTFLSDYWYGNECDVCVWSGSKNIQFEHFYQKWSLVINPEKRFNFYLILKGFHVVYLAAIQFYLKQLSEDDHEVFFNRLPHLSFGNFNPSQNCLVLERALDDLYSYVCSINTKK